MILNTDNQQFNNDKFGVDFLKIENQCQYDRNITDEQIKNNTFRQFVA